MRARWSRTRALIGNGRLTYALAGAHNNGPWENPERFHRTNGVLRYTFGDDANRSSVTAMGYSASWNSTDQIPQRAVDSGLIGRFGAVDASDGGRTERYSLSYQTVRRIDDGEFRLNAYAIQSKLEPVFELHLPPRASDRPGPDRDERRPVRAGRAAQGLRPGGQPQLEHPIRHGRHDQHPRTAGPPRSARPGRPVCHGRSPACRGDPGEHRSRDQRRAVRRELGAVAAVVAQRHRPAWRSIRLQGGELDPAEQRQDERRHLLAQALADLRALDQDRILRQLRLRLSQQRCPGHDRHGHCQDAGSASIR